MNSFSTLFSIERPNVLLLILPVLPVALYTFVRFKKMEKSLVDFVSSSSPAFLRSRRSLFLRTLFRILAWISGVLACAGLSWGTRQVPVQKSGCAVSFVFDISYSMNAMDVDGGRMSRLDAVKLYCSHLLSRMEGVSVSAVISKGDGFLAVPLTQDFSSIDSLVDSLSPSLMTSAGSSLGKGIDCAVSSFPQNSAQSSMIFVFTDGDETDDLMLHSLQRAARFQIPVTLVGFGSEDGAEVLSGDGITPVRTFLMANKMRNMAGDVNRNARKLFSKSDFVRYVSAASRGSALSLLEQIDSSSESFSYEIRSVSRHDFLILLSIVFFVLSFVVGELDASALRKRFGKLSSLLPLSCLLLFVSCSSERMQILKGALDHHNGKMRSATVDFVSVLNDPETAIHRDYALFGLASTYISLEEYDAALEKLDMIVPEKSEDEYKDKSLASAVFYNKGVIFVKKGDFPKALSFFKQAVLASGDNLDARINIELCEQRISMSKKRAGETEMRGVSESSSPEVDPKTAALFNLIREREQNQWKKMDSKTEEKNVLDY